MVELGLIELQIILTNFQVSSKSQMVPDNSSHSKLLPTGPPSAPPSLLPTFSPETIYQQQQDLVREAGSVDLAAFSDFVKLMHNPDMNSTQLPNNATATSSNNMPAVQPHG